MIFSTHHSPPLDEMEPLQPRRQEWEGDDPRYCMEPLQPNPYIVQPGNAWTLYDEELFMTGYSEEA